MNENTASYQFDFASLGGDDSADDDGCYKSHPPFFSSDDISGDGGNDGPRNELSRLLVENDWEDALSVILDRATTDDNAGENANIALVPERAGKERGMLPLHYACREGAPPNIIQELLKAHPGGVSGRTEESGRLALHFVAAGRDGCVKMKHEQMHCDGEDNVIDSSCTPCPCTDDCMLCHDTSNRVKAAQLILAAFPESIQTKDYDGGMTPLHVACLEEAEPDLLTMLLTADPSMASVLDDDGNLPLHWIFHPRMSLKSVESILHAHPKSGACIANCNRALPLHKACTVGAPMEVIRLLLLHYPDGAQITDGNGNLPLHLIIPKCPGEGVKQTERCRDVEMRCKGIHELLKSYPEGARMRNQHGETPLHRALSEEAPLEVVQLLLSASPDCLDDRVLSCSSPTTGEDLQEAGLSVLHLACRYNAPINVVHAILKINPHQAQCLALDGPGGAHLPIHAACRTGASIATIRALLESYPDGAAVPDGNDGRLPLHLECMTRCNAGVVQTLLDVHNNSGAEVVDTKGRTPLHYAVECCGGADDGKGAVKILLGAFPGAMEVKDDEGCVPCLRMNLDEDNSEVTIDKEEVNDADDRRRVVRFS